MDFKPTAKRLRVFIDENEPPVEVLFPTVGQLENFYAVVAKDPSQIAIAMKDLFIELGLSWEHQKLFQLESLDEIFGVLLGKKKL